MLCESTPVNFIGSLLTEERIRACTGDFPYPGVEVVTNIPLYAYREKRRNGKKEGRFIDCDRGLSDVLIKYACGKIAGLILSGELTGLIVDGKTVQPNYREIYVPLQEGVVVSRFWNDEIASVSEPPYSLSERMYKLVEGPENSSQKNFRVSEVPLNKRDSLKKRYTFVLDEDIPPVDRLFYNEVRKVKRPNHDLWLSELLFSLLNRLGIPFEQESFRFTRDTEEMGF